MSITTPSTQHRISIVIPALNEERVVDQVVRDIHACVLGAGFAEFEIILIDDGSTDRTGEIMESLSRDLDRIRVLHNRPNIGLGASYWRGVRAARYEYLMMLCGDGGLPAASLPPILAKVGHADIVVPYMRNMKDVRTGGRLAVSGAYTALLNLLFSLNLKYYNGLPVHRRELLLQMEAAQHGFCVPGRGSGQAADGRFQLCRGSGRSRCQRTAIDGAAMAQHQGCGRDTRASVLAMPTAAKSAWYVRAVQGAC